MEQKKVNHENPIYSKNQPKRDLFNAVMGGTDAIRAGTTTYLPKYPSEEQNDYDIRLGQATIDGILAVGVAGLCGKVFHQEPNTEKVAAAIVPLLENIDNKGNHFDVFARQAFQSAFSGFSLILVDAPQADGVVKSLGDEKRQGIRPYWREYQAKDVTNWRWTVDPVSKKLRLALLVLKEVTNEPDGSFGEKEVTRYRVYRHDAVVTQEVWIKKAGTTKETYEYLLEVEPFTMDKLFAIPAAIIGDITSEPWLMTEARLEVKAYQKESSFDAIEYLSIPILVIKGREGDGLGQAIPYGPSTFLDVPVTGDAVYAQIDSAGHMSLKDSVNSIKQEIAGKLDSVTKEAMPQGDETATEVISDDSKSQARLIVWTQQAQDAYNYALQITAWFLGLGEDKGGEVVLQTAWKIAEEKAKEAKEQKDAMTAAEIAATSAKANGTA